MRQRGFSLMEAMLAMGLIFTILGLISTLMREYSSVSRHAAARDNTFDGVQFALAEMRNELASAVGVFAPSLGSSGSTLGFQRIDPSVDRFPPEGVAPEDDDGLLMWAPRDGTHLLTVEYFREASTGSLIRRATRGGVTRQVMADRIDGLTVVNTSSGYYDLRVSFKEEKRLRNYSTQARVWCDL